MTAYYNEIDPFAAQWLRNLIDSGYIAQGIVDERSIEDVKPEELMQYTQCHFFAGIGVWSYALRQAGWPDDRPVWTGSCPCQPFSAAGDGKGFDDERHLWPSFQLLIEKCKPATVFGEQVASKDADAWIDLVQDDLEAMDYRVGSVAFPSASIGAPNIRDRLFWVADSNDQRLQRQRGFVRLDDKKGREVEKRHSAKSGLASYYRHWETIAGADGISRLIPPFNGQGINGNSSRVGKLRAYGNAINAEAAKAFIESFMELQFDA